VRSHIGRTPTGGISCRSHSGEHRSRVLACALFACGPGVHYLEAMAPRDKQTITWTWQGAKISLGLTGPRALLPPALSSILTRRELAPLQARLAERFANRQHRLAGVRRPPAAQARLDAGAHGRLSRPCAARALPAAGDDRRCGPRHGIRAPSCDSGSGLGRPPRPARPDLAGPPCRACFRPASPGSPRSAAGSTCPCPAHFCTG
jgi:hypothetical protein